MKKRFLIYALIGSMLITPLSYVSASDTNVVSTESSFNELEYFYNHLSETDKETYNELIKHLDLNEQDKLLILREKATTNFEKQLRWKISAVKKVAQVLAKFLKSIGISKGVVGITNYLFEWENDLQKGIEEFLYRYTPLNRTLAYWTAKTIMFIAF